MKSRLMKIYHRLPSLMRNVAISLRGYYVRSWRYGPEAEQLVEQVLERDYWTKEQWKNWQEERLAYTLHYAATTVPYYRQQWASRRQKGDRRSWDYLENWPVLDKEAVRQNPRVFVTDDCNPRNMFPDHTSGTSGKPVVVWWSRRATREWYALFEARTRRWYNARRQETWANIGGQLVIPVAQSKPPFWVWNSAFNQLYLSSYHLSPQNIPYYEAALRKFDVTHIVGYSSSLYSLAREITTDHMRMKVIITNAEPLFSYQREAIARSFGGPVCETYGMTELAASASECPCGSLHLWPEVGYLEAIDDISGKASDSAGHLIGTSLLNIEMPLVRYSIGDMGTVNVPNPCRCGRTLPILASVEGRVDDILVGINGSRVGRLDPVFKADLPIKEAQIIQETPTEIRVRCVPDTGFSDSTKNYITHELQQRLGPMTVSFECMEKIPRTANGKFRAVVCKLPTQNSSST